MRLDLRPANDLAGARRAVLDAAARELSAVLAGAAAATTAGIRAEAAAALAADPAVASLLSGELLGALGIPGVAERWAAVAGRVAASIAVTARPCRVAGAKVVGGVDVGILPADYADLLGLDAAAYTSRPSGEAIPWLDWLLTRGHSVVVAGYDCFYDLTPAERAKSRTGLALMRRGDSFQVPPAYAGTVDDNFLTRAFDEAFLGRVGAILQREIRART